jgi:superfamily I DNA/RNA helicase
MLNLHTMNPRQLEAVRHTEGPLLVLAGAGSGKTRVITYRIAHLLLHKEVAAENILAVTFTNKAAREMQERTAALVGKKRYEEVILSTFHSLGVRILRQEIWLLGYKRNFAIYATSDQLGLIRQALRESGAADGRKVDAEAVLWKISGAKNALLGPGQLPVPSGDDWAAVAAEVYPRYQSLLRACNAIDFDDIIMLTVRLLQDHPEVLARWQERFHFIMVDEYQDTNPSQYLFISLLAARYKNLCVVGDDDQSIYGWRGADVEKILAFEKEYPGCRVVKLEQNYRSTGTILAAANSVIKNNPKRKEKTLWTKSGDGAGIDLVVAHDDEEEATIVSERIRLECFKGNRSYGDFAILYRTNAQSRAFEEQLRFADIPYVLIGGMQFYERKEVKDALCYLRAIANPKDEQALLRIVNFPRRGIGDSTLVRLNQWSQEEGVGLFEAFGGVGEIEGVNAATRERVLAFFDLLSGEIAAFKRRGRLAERIAELFKRVGIEEELHRTIDDPKVARRRMENVEQIVNSLAGYEERTMNPTLSGFLEKVSLMDEDRFSDRDKKEHGQDAVTLMSLHSSKGLEFPFVFLVGLEEEILPHKRSIYEDFTIDEERRLCYVGITRARQQLVITRCLQRKRYGKLEEREPSRFVAEIPAELLNEAGGKECSAEENERLAENAFAKLRSMFR